jgi:hypothetical protein
VGGAVGSGVAQGAVLGALAAEVAWLGLSSAYYEAFASALAQRGRDLVYLLVLASLALSSGSLVLVERRAKAFVDSERERTLAETLYALVLFGASFFGTYAFFGWYFSPPS